MSTKLKTRFLASSIITVDLFQQNLAAKFNRDVPS